MKRVHAHVFGEYRTTLVHELQEESRERYSYTDRGVSACISACPPLTISIFMVPCEYMVNNDLHEDACRFCGCPSWRVNTSPTIPTREPTALARTRSSTRRARAMEAMGTRASISRHGGTRSTITSRTALSPCLRSGELRTLLRVRFSGSGGFYRPDDVGSKRLLGNVWSFRRQILVEMSSTASSTCSFPEAELDFSTHVVTNGAVDLTSALTMAAFCRDARSRYHRKIRGGLRETCLCA